MLFRLVRPVRRTGSTVPQFVQRIPSDVRQKAIGRTLEVPLGDGFKRILISPNALTVRFSIGSRDPADVKARQAIAAAYLTRFWESLRQQTVTHLSHRQATALAGDLYAAWADVERSRTTAVQHVPGEGFKPARASQEELEAGFVNFAMRLEDKLEAADDNLSMLEPLLGRIVDLLLLRKNILWVDDESRHRLLEACTKALRDAMASRARNAAGDYAADPSASRFPPWEPPTTAPPRVATVSAISLTGMLEDWWREAKAAGRKPSTYESYRNTMTNFVAFLKHDDAGRVRREDVIAFKDHRLGSVNPRTGKPISAKTVKDSDIAALKTIFGWAVSNARLPSNPTQGVTIKLGKRQRLRSPGFTDEEARAILAACNALHLARERPETFAAKRWVPWLLAYTGARVGEIAQLRKEDVHQTAHGQSFIRITPKAGTVKTDEAREVPLHPHLIEKGFLQFVVTSKEGHLFLRPDADGNVLGPLQGLKNRLAEFARNIVPDPQVAPSHGWRHRFKTVGMEAGIDHRVLDAIQGQSPRTVAETYGEVTMTTKCAAIEKLPRMGG